MKISLLVSVLIAISTTAQAANDKTLPNGKPFIIINGQIEEVQNSVEALADSYEQIIAEIKASIADLGGQMDAINNKIANLQAVDEELKGKIEQLMTDIANQGTDIEQLVADYNQLKEQLEALEATVATSVDIANLQEQIDSKFASIASVSESLATLLSQVENNSTLIGLLEKDVANLEIVKQNLIPAGECQQGQAVVSLASDGSITCGYVDGGSSGASLTIAWSADVAVNKNTYSSAVANCLDGYDAVGGGFYMADGADNSINLVNSVHGGDVGSWKIFVKNESASRAAIIRAQAVCLKM
ncbi:hypothetical protein M3924_001086 [Vibrio fluvialis]|uniref:coiled-coil domain-containing protein n=1 Tax=Vibrio fluvialis TaxID=676 RepID=UPI0005C92810|nr:hypothetical protein [Vibrio fluvialis]EKO3485483.1 hypothetical protein [Vibrio fluvialis]EME3968559.1 hypothetical protein [Vibrio fluvialis]